MDVHADLGGSLTIPSIKKSDLDKLGANKMEGMLGYVVSGAADIGYIFDTATYFKKLPPDHKFSGVGAFGYIGVGKGYAGQISGSFENGQQVDVYVNVHYTPVLEFGATGKAYFLKNRVAVGLSAGTKMIMDTKPSYEIYSTAPDVIAPEVGTIIVDNWMMTHMNPFSANFKLFAEYNIPILDTFEILLGGYGAFNIFSPGYVTMPESVMAAAKTNKGFDPKTPMKSYFINSFDFGLRLGAGVKL